MYYRWYNLVQILLWRCWEITYRNVLDGRRDGHMDEHRYMDKWKCPHCSALLQIHSILDLIAFIAGSPQIDLCHRRVASNVLGVTNTCSWLLQAYQDDLYSQTCFVSVFISGYWIDSEVGSKSDGMVYWLFDWESGSIWAWEVTIHRVFMDLVGSEADNAWNLWWLLTNICNGIFRHTLVQSFISWPHKIQTSHLLMSRFHHFAGDLCLWTDLICGYIWICTFSQYMYWYNFENKWIYLFYYRYGCQHLTFDLTSNTGVIM